MVLRACYAEPGADAQGLRYAATSSVWYKGVEHREVTAVTPFDREFFNIGGGKKLPVAQAGTERSRMVLQEGDIPEGEHVQITCDEHWQLTAKGKEFPKCLNTGEFEKGKECEPIMCSQVPAALSPTRS
eukprot:3769884-Rhodomonas_salina.2